MCAPTHTCTHIHTRAHTQESQFLRYIHSFATPVCWHLWYIVGKFVQRRKHSLKQTKSQKFIAHEELTVLPQICQCLLEHKLMSIMPPIHAHTHNRRYYSGSAFLTCGLTCRSSSWCFSRNLSFSICSCWSLICCCWLEVLLPRTPPGGLWGASGGGFTGRLWLILWLIAVDANSTASILNNKA